MPSEPASPKAATLGRDEIEIHPLQSLEDAAAFRSLNEEWIQHYFVLEPKDRETLNDPAGTILAKGGQVYLLNTAASSAPAACVALIPMGDGTFELSKMAVSPSLRGLGLGRRLLEHAIVQARALGAKRLFLGSNSILSNAVHLYESVGFTHLPPERRPSLGYARADVYMEREL